jgi:serine phosphatase RsbU (regulator of sigma subunit)
MNRPADLTGGDYYDWQELPDSRLAIVLADVTGHGIGPALVMAVCRAYARASAPIISDPAVLVARLNDLLHADLPSDRFITFAIAILSPDGRVELLSAGHGPTLLYRAATGDIQQFGGDGLPLGIAPGEVYGPTSSFRMEQGDALMMLTDGFFEWQRPSDGECFGIPRLCEAMIGSIRGQRAGDDGTSGDGVVAAAMIRSIDAAVTKFADGAPQADDMTAVVVRRTAASIPPDDTKVSVEVAVAAAAPVAAAAAAGS